MTKVMDQIVALSTAAFGLVAALAWNGAIQQLFRDIFGEQSSLAAMFGYALLVTILAVFVTLYISRLADKTKTLAEKAKERIASRIKRK